MERRVEVTHEPCGTESAHGEGGERAGEHVAGSLVAETGGGANVEDEIAPCADLRADVEELSDDGQNKMPLRKADVSRGPASRARRLH